MARTLGAKDKQKRKEKILRTAQLVGGLGLLGGSLYYDRSASKANQFLGKYAKGFDTSTRQAASQDFGKLPWLSKKMFMQANRAAEQKGQIAKGTTARMKATLRRGYYDSIGLTDDLDLIRSAKKQARTGDIAGQKEFGDRVIQKARDKAKNKGKTFKQIRRESRKALGFNRYDNLVSFYKK